MMKLERCYYINSVNRVTGGAASFLGIGKFKIRSTAPIYYNNKTCEVTMEKWGIGRYYGPGCNEGAYISGFKIYRAAVTIDEHSRVITVY